MSEKPRLCKTNITTSPILAYPDADKQYYLFTDSSKHSWNGVLVWYDEQRKDDGTKLNIPHPITYQSGTFQGSQKKLEYTNKRSLCDLHVISQNGLLFKRCPCYDMEWPCTFI